MIGDSRTVGGLYELVLKISHINWQRLLKTLSRKSVGNHNLQIEAFKIITF